MLGVPARELEQLGAEPEREDGRGHRATAPAEMPELVHEHEDAEHEDEGQDVGHVVVLALDSGSAGARRLQSGLSIRAGPGIEFLMAASVPGCCTPWRAAASSAASMLRRWPGTAPRPRGRRHGDLVGRVQHHQVGVAGLEGPVGQAQAGEGSWSGASNSSRRQSSRLRVGSAPSQRSGHEKACWMGSRMSVTPSWAMIDPSVSSTSEWTTDWGWTTTSIAAGGVPAASAPRSPRGPCS